MTLDALLRHAEQAIAATLLAAGILFALGWALAPDPHTTTPKGH